MKRPSTPKGNDLGNQHVRDDTMAHKLAGGVGGGNKGQVLWLWNFIWRGDPIVAGWSVRPTKTPQWFKH
jgi:hypothetical protein